MLSGPLAGQQFAPGGTGVVPFNSGTPTGTPGYFANGDGLVIPLDVTANAPLNTKKAFGRFSLDVTPDINAHVQGVYSRSRIDYIIEANGFIVPTGATLFSGNPYLPADLQGAMDGSGMDSALVDKYPFGPSPDTSEVTNFYMANVGLEGKFGSHQQPGTVRRYLLDQGGGLLQPSLPAAKLRKTHQCVAFHRRPAGG